MMQKNLYRFSRRSSTSSKLSAFTESPATEQVATFTERCEDNKTYINDLCYRLRKECRTNQSYIEDGKRVADCFVSFHQKLLQTGADFNLLECLEKTRDFQLNMCDLQSRLNTTLENKVTGKLNESARDTYNATKTSTKNFQKAKATYETALSQSKNRRNEVEIAQCKEAYMAAGNQTLNNLKDSSKEVELHLLQSLCDYWDAYNDYFTKCAKWMGNVRPVVDGYREHLNKVREEIKASRANRASDNPFQNAENSKVFGCSLEQLAEREGNTGAVPKFYERCIQWITQNGLELEGIFRISAMKSVLNDLKTRLDSGEHLDFADQEDPHVIPGVFKQLLRELPEPLLTFKLYPEFIKTNAIEDEEKKLAKMIELVEQLPKVNKALFKQLLFLLAKIADNEEITKMGPSNLSRVVGPNILYDREINPATMVEDMENANAILVLYINRCHEIFKLTSTVQAARENDLGSLKRLHAEGKSLDEVDADDKRTPIHYAALHANIDMATFLLQNQVDVNALDVHHKSALYYACKEDDRSQVLAQLLVNAGADANVQVEGKSILEHAESISSEFHAALVDTLQALEDEKARLLAPPPSSAADPEPEQPATIPTPEPEAVVETSKPKTPRGAAETEQGSEAVSSTEAEKEATPAPVQVTASAPVPVQAAAAAAPPRPRETAEQIAQRSREKAEALLKGRIALRGGEPIAPVPAALAAKIQINSEQEDADVNDIIFERVRSLQSLVKEEIPLPSVYSLININEMTEVLTALLKAALPEQYGASEIGNLNTALKSAAEMLKNVFTQVKKFASLFDDDEKRVIIANAIAVQDSIKVLIASIKKLNTEPNDAASRNALFSTIKQLTDIMFKFYRACESASNEYVSTTSQNCAESITKILAATGGDSKEDLDSAAANTALFCLKLSQLVRAKAAQHPVEQVSKSLITSATTVEKSILELINESKKSHAQGDKSNTELTNLGKKILLEFRQISTTFASDTVQTSLSTKEQCDLFNSFTEDVALLLEEISSVTFSTDLDKALVLQIKLIAKKLEELGHYDTLESPVLLQNVNTITEALKKIRVGITSMDKKTQDFTLNRKLKIWAEALLSSILVLRLAVASQILNLPTGELQLAVRTRSVISVCKDFYQQLALLRGG